MGEPPPRQRADPGGCVSTLDASLKKEEQDREELRKREYRISQRTQEVVAREARRAREGYNFSRAMRLALAGEPSEGERARGMTPESTRRAELAAAAHAALNVAGFAAHSKSVLVGGYSPDETRVVTASLDNTARIWDSVRHAAPPRDSQRTGRDRPDRHSGYRATAHASDPSVAQVRIAAAIVHVIKGSH